MTIAPARSRPLGTMIAYGFADLALSGELALALRLGAVTLEILPEWRLLPDPVALRVQVADAGLAIHSAHGCWGGQSANKTHELDSHSSWTTVAFWPGGVGSGGGGRSLGPASAFLCRGRS